MTWSPFWFSENSSCENIAEQRSSTRSEFDSSSSSSSFFSFLSVVKQWEMGREEGTIRIFVGGLGLSVTEEDVHKTFSSLGRVESMEIVRTKGRSFAYLDFILSSDKALARLFSTYNGCLWKGGRLKLENAKEHYLTRLRHEWARDAELERNARSSNVDTAKNRSSSGTMKKFSEAEKMRIYFPKLEKVKSVPLRGTGKHKYSFQRVEIPSLPNYFIDQEHRDPKVSKEPLCQPQREGNGINEQELSIMTTVMNKLFEREDRIKANATEAKSTNYMAITDGLDSLADEDGLIINMVSGESALGEPQNSKDRMVRKMHERKRKSFLADDCEGSKSMPEKKGRFQNHLNEAKIHLEEPESDGKHLHTHSVWSQKSAWRDLISAKADNKFDISQIAPTTAAPEIEQPASDNLFLLLQAADADNGKRNFVNQVKTGSQSAQCEEVKEVAAAKSDAVSSLTARGVSWLQKSSWTQLVSDTTNTSFSISQILPDLTFEKQELPQNDNKHNGMVNCEVFFSGKKEENSGRYKEQTRPINEPQTARETTEVSAPTVGMKGAAGELGTRGTCSFMKSAASVREWTKTKAALSGSLKKKMPQAL